LTDLIAEEGHVASGDDLLGHRDACGIGPRQRRRSVNFIRAVRRTT
jgi:hypothetical protein